MCQHSPFKRRLNTKVTLSLKVVRDFYYLTISNY